MPLTKLDTTAALVVIDMQKALSVCRPCTLPARSSAELPNSRALSASEVCRSFSSTWLVRLRAAPMPEVPVADLPLESGARGGTQLPQSPILGASS
jgi:hypothetical protein